jgi:hypothetical protein
LDALRGKVIGRQGAGGGKRGRITFGFGSGRLFGNGTRFVLQFDVFRGRGQLLQGAHQDQVGQRALEDPMEARLVAVHQFQGRLGGYGGEAIGEAG